MPRVRYRRLSREEQALKTLETPAIALTRRPKTKPDRHGEGQYRGQEQQWRKEFLHMLHGKPSISSNYTS
jgi:hypothetical protein